jgi:hypothetical protein
MTNGAKMSAKTGVALRLTRCISVVLAKLAEYRDGSSQSQHNELKSQQL